MLELMRRQEEGRGRIFMVCGFDLEWPEDKILSPGMAGPIVQFYSGELKKHSEVFALKPELRAQQKDRVLIHLAGLAHAGRCEEDPAAVYAANVELTASLLDMARKGHFGHVIFPSTGLVYGGQHRDAVDEQSELAPPNVYAHSKLAAEQLVRYFAGRYDLPATILRIANVYGPGANPDTVAAIVTNQARRKQSVHVRDLRPVRDFVYIQDVVKILADLANAEEMPPPYSHRTWNVSTGDGTSVYDLAAKALRVMGVPENEIDAHISDERGTPVPVTTAQDSEHTDRLIMRNDLLTAHLGCSMTSLEDALRESLTEKN